MAASAPIGRLISCEGLSMSIITTLFVPSGACSLIQMYFSDSIVRVANPIAAGLIPRLASCMINEHHIEEVMNERQRKAEKKGDNYLQHLLESNR